MQAIGCQQAMEVPEALLGCDYCCLCMIVFLCFLFVFRLCLAGWLVGCVGPASALRRPCVGPASGLPWMFPRIGVTFSVCLSLCMCLAYGFVNSNSNFEFVGCMFGSLVVLFVGWSRQFLYDSSPLCLPVSVPVFGLWFCEFQFQF